MPTLYHSHCRREKVADLLGQLEDNGQFFTVEFYKADGSYRIMNARFLKEHTRARYISNGEHHTCLTVKDMVKKEFRQIPLDRVVRIKANNKIYTVVDA